MRTLFRPQLDRLPAIDEPQLSTDELAALTAAQKTAAEKADTTLTAMYGAMAGRHGVDAALAEEVDAPLSPSFALDAARAVAALDHFNARLRPPDFDTGGLTSARNRAIAERLRPYLAARLLAASTAAAEVAVLWRTIARTIPEQWIPDRLVRGAVDAAFAHSTLFERDEVSMDRRLRCLGGEAWLRQARSTAWHRLRDRLNEKRPTLIGSIRPFGEGSAIETPLAVAYAWTAHSSRDVAAHLYLPERAHAATTMRLTLDGNDVTAITWADTEAGSETEEISDWLGFTVLDLPRSRPPLFGLRARTHRVVPWALFWFVRRYLTIWLGRAPIAKSSPSEGRAGKPRI
jgi:hypothetical protein